MFLFFLVPLFSWDYKTHRILGGIAKEILYNSTNFDKMNQLFSSNFSEASVLPDKLKFTKEYGWTRKLHYIDIDLVEQDNFITNEIIEKYCKKNCITWGIKHFHRQIKGKKRQAKQFNLILDKFRYHFLLHFLQDICQPFHLFGKTGGNDIFIRYYNNEKCNIVSVHKLWDTVLPEKYNFDLDLGESKFHFRLNRYVNLHYHIAVKEYNYYKSVNFTLTSLNDYYNIRAKFILNDLFTNYRHLVLHYFK